MKNRVWIGISGVIMIWAFSENNALFITRGILWAFVIASTFIFFPLKEEEEEEEEKESHYLRRQSIDPLKDILTNGRIPGVKKGQEDVFLKRITPFVKENGVYEHCANGMVIEIDINLLRALNYNFQHKGKKNEQS